ncbi:MAG: zinc-ribbon domain-containing protein [Myxococcaceae bacterium]
MIVTCEQCQTRFRIPDEKVTPKGVRVRCTRCQHTFRVAKPFEAAAVQQGASDPDPFAFFKEAESPAEVPAFSAAPPSEPEPEPEPHPQPESQPEESPSFDELFGDAASVSAHPPPLPQQESQPVEEDPFAAMGDGSFEPAPVGGSASPSFDDLAEASSDAHGAGGDFLADVPEASAVRPPLPPELSPPPPSEGRPPRRLFAKSVADQRGGNSDSAAPKLGWGGRIFRGVAGIAVISLLGGLAFLLMRGGQWTSEGNVDARVVELTNGLYETRAGKPVFFVRGDVENRGSSAQTLRVRVELLDGKSVVRTAETRAGALPTPEELHDVASTTDAEALFLRLVKEARTVDVGKSAPFLVAWFDYPPEITTLRLRVKVERDEHARVP